MAKITGKEAAANAVRKRIKAKEARVEMLRAEIEAERRLLAELEK